VPGHTSGHIAFVLRDAGVAFVGDTLFAMGCGRLFEGTPEQMFESLRRIASLPDDTRLYCAHEYTLANARFAAQADPANTAIARRLEAVTQAREAGEMTVPTTVADELATNVFVRAPNAVKFAELRHAKDAFR
jgi:hydroxyacylglutathione hydrolase